MEDRIQCGDDIDNFKAHVVRDGTSLVALWDHIEQSHPSWQKELLGKSDATIRRELTRWFKVPVKR